MIFKKSKKIILGLLIAFLISSSGFFLTPQKIEASGWPVIDALNAALKTVGNVYEAISSVATKYLSMKESFLDGLAWTLINVAIEKIADSTVDWINRGFPDDGPAFITDFGGLLTDVGDQTIGEFIAGSPLAFLCSPFGLDIKIALSLQFGGEREAYCTLSEVFENADNAIDDLGNDWSWSKFNNIAQTQNNAYGAYLGAYTELTLKMAEERDKTVQKSSWGQGFFEFQHCEDDYEETECDDVMEEGRCETYMVPGKCETQTPGGLIEDSLVDVLSLGNDRLVIADEINEIVGALLNQLIKSVFNKEGGLLKSTPGATHGFTQIPAELVDNLVELIDDTITIEENYKGWKQKSLDIVLMAENHLLALIECWETDFNLTPAERETEQAWAQSIIDNTITPLKTSLSTDIESARKNIEDELGLMLEEIAAATDPETGDADPTVITDVSSRFNKLTLHTKVDVVLAEQEYHGPTVDGSTTILVQMNGIINQVRLKVGTEEGQCQGDFNPSTYTPLDPECGIDFVPGDIPVGGSSTLGWWSINSTSGSIDNGVGDVPSSSLEAWSTTVSPSATTIYIGTAIGAGGTTTCPTTITVY